MTMDRNNFQESLRKPNGEFNLVLLEFNKLSHQIQDRDQAVVKYKLGAASTGQAFGLANALTVANKIQAAYKQKICHIVPALRKADTRFRY